MGEVWKGARVLGWLRRQQAAVTPAVVGGIKLQEVMRWVIGMSHD